MSHILHTFLPTFLPSFFLVDSEAASGRGRGWPPRQEVAHKIRIAAIFQGFKGSSASAAGAAAASSLS